MEKTINWYDVYGLDMQSPSRNIPEAVWRKLKMPLVTITKNYPIKR